jgi:hypothetical protein
MRWFMIVLTCFNHISDALEGWTKFPWIQAQKLLGCIGVDAIVHICGYGNIYIYRRNKGKMQQDASCKTFLDLLGFLFSEDVDNG